MDETAQTIERVVRAEFEERIHQEIAEATREIESHYKAIIQAEIDEAMEAAWLQADEDARERYQPWIDRAASESSDEIRAKYEPQIQDEVRARLRTPSRMRDASPASGKRRSKG